MKNLYDVETGVKKDVVGTPFKEDLNERVDCPGAFSVRGSQEDCGEVLDWARLYSGSVSIIIVAITNATFPVWPLHEPDLSYADPNYGKLARPGV